MPPKAKQPKQPKMRKPRAARAGRAGKSAAGKSGSKQSQKIIVQLGDRQPFGFPQQNQLTIQDIIKLVSTRGKRLGDHEQEEQLPLTTGGIVGAGPLMPEPVKPNIAALGSRLLNPTDDFSPQPGSIELLKTKMKEPELTSTSILKSIFTEEPELTSTSILKPIFTEEASPIEINKSKKPVFTEQTESIELNKSKKPIFTEQTESIELNKSKAPRKKKQPKLELVEVPETELQTKPSEIVQEVFNRPITTKSLFEQIAKTQPPPEAYPDIPPYPMEIIPKPKKGTGVKRGSYTEKAFLKGLEQGTEQGIDIGFPAGRDIQNTEVMKVENLQPGQLTLVPNEQNQHASSSSDINFA